MPMNYVNDGEFRFCPRCDSDQIYQTDYENEEGIEDTNGRACESCGWEGDVHELVSKD